jgi:type IV pilus assembly protein PilQ
MRATKVAIALLLLCGLLLCGLQPVWAESMGDENTRTAAELTQRFSVNFRNLDARNAFKLLEAKSGLIISVASDVSQKVSFSASNISLKDILDELTTQNGLTYSIQNGTIRVMNAGTTESGPNLVHAIVLKYANPAEMLPRIAPMLPKSDKLMIDENANSLIFVGSAEGLEKVSQLVAIFDEAPKQILIQGMIIETNETFLRNVGMTVGDVTKTAQNNGGQTTAFMSNPPSGSPNIGLAISGTTVLGIPFELNLAAAESKGDAKVISRPKVVTMNNKPATINSGLTISVKTLSSTQSGQPGGAPTAVTGGVSQLNAGLMVTITPTIVGDGKVKLALTVNSSSPDDSQSVDGIPGIQTNSATTNVIVENGRTAIIAGLIKQAKSVTHNGVPILKDIPILGALFRDDNRRDLNNELAIFVTPSILGLNQETIYPKVPSPRELLDKVGEPSKPRADNQALGYPAREVGSR